MQMVKNFSPINTILPAPDLETRTARSYTIAYAKNLYSTMSFLVYVLTIDAAAPLPLRKSNKIWIIHLLVKPETPSHIKYKLKLTL